MKADHEEWLVRQLADLDAANARLAEARDVLDRIEVLAANDKTGCGTCWAISGMVAAFLAASVKG